MAQLSTGGEDQGQKSQSPWLFALPSPQAGPAGWATHIPFSPPSAFAHFANGLQSLRHFPQTKPRLPSSAEARSPALSSAQAPTGPATSFPLPPPSSQDAGCIHLNTNTVPWTTLKSSLGERQGWDYTSEQEKGGSGAVFTSRRSHLRSFVAFQV